MNKIKLAVIAVMVYIAVQGASEAIDNVMAAAAANRVNIETVR